MDRWRQRNVIAFEMEASALFTAANVLGYRAGAICVPGSNLIRGRSTYQGQDVGQYKAGLGRMIEVSLEAVATLATWDMPEKG